MIEITPAIAIDEKEVEEEFIQAAGPGGQNVNKVATAVQLRFNAAASPSLPDDVRSRLAALAGSRMTKDGVLIILARRFRSQKANRDDAYRRLIALLQEAARPPQVRRRTKPSPAVKKRRLEDKRRQSVLKRRRRPLTREAENY